MRFIDHMEGSGWMAGAGTSAHKRRRTAVVGHVEYQSGKPYNKSKKTRLITDQL